MSDCLSLCYFSSLSEGSGIVTRDGTWATRLLDHLESLDCLPSSLRLVEAGFNFGHAGWCKDSEEKVV